MEEKELNNEPRNPFHQNVDLSDRRFEDRRREPCEGYTYVTTVGWICRREQSRRKNGDDGQ